MFPIISYKPSKLVDTALGFAMPSFYRRYIS